MFETKNDRENQIRLGKKYEFLTGEKYKIIHFPTFCAFDTARYVRENKECDAFIEIKSKPEPFKDNVVFTYTKTDFVRACHIPCYYLLERGGVTRLFDMTEIVELFDNNRSNEIKKEEWVRKDRDPNAQDWNVLLFPAEWGVEI